MPVLLYGQLNAYRDGEMDPRDALAMEARLAREPDLRRRLAELEGIDDALRRALDEGLEGAGWEDIEAEVAALGAEARLGPRRAPGPFTRNFGQIAVASLAALGIGLLAGQYWTASRLQAPPAAEPAVAALDPATVAHVVDLALDSQVVGAKYTWTDQATGAFVSVTPTATFRAQDGRLCREYVRTSKAGEQTETARAVACRDGEDANWRTDVEAKPRDKDD